MNDFQQQRMIQMMGQMPQHNEEGYDDMVTAVDFSLSENPNPKKQRRENIKRAIKALKPVKRSFFIPGYRRRKSHQCSVDGIDCRDKDYGDLFSMYFRNTVTLEVQPFRHWTGVLPGKGRQLDSTLCPQHMMLYHSLMEWVEQEEAEADPGFLTRLAKRGVAFVPIKRHKEEESSNPLIVKYTPIIMEMMKDGIPMHHYINPITGENDLTTIILDNRVLKATAPTGNKLSSMDMAKYYQVVEKMGQQDHQR